MGVLHVIHRVSGVFLLSNLDIEVDRLVGGARKHEVARRVDAHFLDKLLKRDHLARALRHANRATVTEEIHELAENHFKRALVTPRGKHCLATLHVPVVIGSPNVDQVGKAPLDLVVVVRHVGEEVRELAVFLDKDAILLVTESGRLEPGRAIFLEDIALRVHRLEGAVDSGLPVLIGNVKRTLGEPGVKRGAETRKHGLVVLEHLDIRALAERNDALFLGNIEPLFAIGIENLARDIDHIGATVAVLGHRDIAATKLLVARRHRATEVIHLSAVIVDVELLGHVEARMAQHARHRVAERRPTPMADMHGARRVRRDILKIDAPRIRRSLTTPEIHALAARLGDNARQRSVREANVNEPRARNLGRGDKVVLRQMRHNRVSDIPRFHMRSLGSTQGDRRRPIAVSRIARTLERCSGDLLQGERSVCNGGAQCHIDNFFNLLT